MSSKVDKSIFLAYTTQVKCMKGGQDRHFKEIRETL